VSLLPRDVSATLEAVQVDRKQEGGAMPVAVRQLSLSHTRPWRRTVSLAHMGRAKHASRRDLSGRGVDGVA